MADDQGGGLSKAYEAVVHSFGQLYSLLQGSQQGQGPSSGNGTSMLESIQQQQTAPQQPSPAAPGAGGQSVAAAPQPSLQNPYNPPGSDGGNAQYQQLPGQPPRQQGQQSLLPAGVSMNPQGPNGVPSYTGNFPQGGNGYEPGLTPPPQPRMQPAAPQSPQFAGLQKPPAPQAPQGNSPQAPAAQASGELPPMPPMPPPPQPSTRDQAFQAMKGMGLDTSNPAIQNMIPALQKQLDVAAGENYNLKLKQQNEVASIRQHLASTAKLQVETQNAIQKATTTGSKEDLAEAKTKHKILMDRINTDLKTIGNKNSTKEQKATASTDLASARKDQAAEGLDAPPAPAGVSSEDWTKVVDILRNNPSPEATASFKKRFPDLDIGDIVD